MRTNFKGIILAVLAVAAAVAATVSVRGANVWNQGNPNNPNPNAFFTGSWKAEFDGAIGHLKYTFDLAQAGTNLTGKATRVANTGTIVTDITEGKVDSRIVSFVELFTVAGQDQPLRVEYKGTISPTNANQLDLTRVVSGYTTNKIVLTRQLPAMVTGKWDAEFETQIGHVKYTYDLTQDGVKLTGKAIRNQDDQKTETVITNGVVSGEEISFLEPLKIQGQDQQIDITYKGKLAGDEIKFTRSVADFATNEVTAKRQK